MCLFQWVDCIFLVLVLHDDYWFPQSPFVVELLRSYLNPVNYLFFISHFQLQNPDLPCFMFGHSMGGLIAIRSILRNRSFFGGIVLEGPLITPSSKPNFIMNQLSKLARVLIPDYVYLTMDLEDVTRDQVRHVIQKYLTHWGWLDIRLGSIGLG